MEELLAAEEWGVPPWVVAEGPAIWLERWKQLRYERAQKAARERG